MSAPSPRSSSPKSTSPLNSSVLPPAPRPLTSRQGRVQSFPDLLQGPPRPPRSKAASPGLSPTPFAPPAPSSVLDALKRPSLPVPSPSLDQPRRNSFSNFSNGDYTFPSSSSSPSSSQPSSPAAPFASLSPSMSPGLSRSTGFQAYGEKKRLAKEAAREGRWERWRRAVREWMSGPAFWVAMYSAALLLSSVGNSLAFKKMINRMENYVYFLNQFTTIVFTPIFFAAVWYQLRFTDSITKDMRAFPQLKFFWMGVFDSVSGVLTLFGAVHTSGGNQALLTNAVIPVTMLLSYFILHQRYLATQYVGALVILLGIGTVLLPQLFPSWTFLEGERDSGGDVGQDDNSDLPLFNFLFLLSVIPSALSSIYKELAFVDADIDANYLQSWVSLWQTLFGFLLIPLNTMKFLGPQAVHWDELWTAFSDGWWCLLGYNLLVPPHCTMHHVPDATQRPCDDCRGAWLPIAAYVVFNLLFNVFTVLLIKHGSATLMFIIMTLRMPLVQWAFSIRALNDPPDSFGYAAGCGLLVILLGLVCYRWPGKAAGKAGLRDAEPLLQRAKTTGGLGVGDYGEDTEQEDRMIIPVMGFNLVFAARQHRRVARIRLKRTGSEIRSALYASLGVIDSPYVGRSPMPGRGSGAGAVSSPVLGGMPSIRSRTPPNGYGSMMTEQKQQHTSRDLRASLYAHLGLNID